MEEEKYISDEEKIYWAAFYYLGVGGEKNVRRLIKKFGNLQEAWDYFRRIKVKHAEASPKLISAKMVEKIKIFSLEKLRSDLEKYSIGLIILDSPEYPSRLKQIKNPPLVLYYRGKNKKCSFSTEAMMAVVGTRRGTAYGRQALNYILPEIIKRNVAIVSGLARGIDIQAHKITLEQGGKAIAVLAGGLEQVYPPEHKKIAEEIICKGGWLVSEHPPETRYLRQYFPARNRIISGLSDTILVVEAQEKSGALITANFAFSERKTVFTVPGSIFSSESRGTNRLFNKGALPALNSENLLDFFFPGQKYQKTPESAVFGGKLENVNNLNKEEKEIFKFVSAGSPIPLNLIIRKTGFSSSKVIATITRFEIEGLIGLVDGGYVKLR